MLCVQLSRTLQRKVKLSKTAHDSAQLLGMIATPFHTAPVEPASPMSSSSEVRGPQDSNATADGQPCWQDNEDFFRYTRDRFVRNEQHEMSQRHRRYNINELARLAAEAVGSKSCIDVEKYPDGSYNKALLLTMEDGKQVVAKIPNPNAGRPHFTTASEVATMDFLRNTLGSPVPEVYAWCSRAETSSVGSEYIIMGKVQGVQLADEWPNMPVSGRLKIIKDLARHQRAWSNTSFSRYGSLYYAKDLDKSDVQTMLYTDEHGTKHYSSIFTVGPSTGRDFCDRSRAGLELDLGPWTTVEDYLSAIGDRETQCVKSLSQLPKSPIALLGPGTYLSSRPKKLKALQYYHKLFPYIVPTDQSISASHLWHSDLHLNNLFVDPKNPSEIVAFIDWQCTALAPLFLHARQPNFLDYEGSQVEGLERPHLPPNIKELSPPEERQARLLWIHQSLSAAYRALMHKQLPTFYRAMEFRDTESCNLIGFATNLHIDGEAQYLALIEELEKTWAEIPAVKARGNPPFPFHFSDSERAEIAKDAHGAELGVKAMGAVMRGIGELAPLNGTVPAERYDEMKYVLGQMKAQVMEKFARDESERKVWEEVWPWDD